MTAPSPPDKQTAGFSSPHDWLMNLAMDLAALCDMWGESGANACHLTVYSVDVAFIAMHH